MMEKRSLVLGWLRTLFLMMLQDRQGHPGEARRRGAATPCKLPMPHRASCACRFFQPHPQHRARVQGRTGTASPEAKIVLGGDHAAHDGHAGQRVDAYQCGQQCQDSGRFDGGGPAGRIGRAGR